MAFVETWRDAGRYVHLPGPGVLIPFTAIVAPALGPISITGGLEKSDDFGDFPVLEKSMVC